MEEQSNNREKVQNFIDDLSTEQKEELERELLKQESLGDLSGDSGESTEEDAAYGGVFDGMTRGLSNRFDALDNKKKATLILVLAIVILIIGLIYLYIFIKNIFG